MYTVPSLKFMGSTGQQSRAVWNLSYHHNSLQLEVHCLENNWMSKKLVWQCSHQFQLTDPRKQLNKTAPFDNDWYFATNLDTTNSVSRAHTAKYYMGKWVTQTTKSNVSHCIHIGQRSSPGRCTGDLPECPLARCGNPATIHVTFSSACFSSSPQEDRQWSIDRQHQIHPRHPTTEELDYQTLAYAIATKKHIRIYQKFWFPHNKHFLLPSQTEYLANFALMK